MGVEVFVVLNNVDVSVEYVVKFKYDIEEYVFEVIILIYD